MISDGSPILRVECAGSPQWAEAQQGPPPSDFPRLLHGALPSNFLPLPAMSTFSNTKRLIRFGSVAPCCPACETRHAGAACLPPPQPLPKQQSAHAHERSLVPGDRREESPKQHVPCVTCTWRQSGKEYSQAPVTCVEAPESIGLAHAHAESQVQSSGHKLTHNRRTFGFACLLVSFPFLPH